MLENSILLQFTKWVSENWTVSAIAGGITWDVVKKYLVNPFVTRFKKYFRDDSQVEEYLKSLCNNKSINKSKPYRDIEDQYEELTGKDIPQDFLEELKQFIIENQETIENMNKESNIVFDIKKQNAKRDIYNITASEITINNR